jgi:transposase
MKLLPYIISFVKDAAKAVKRICLEEFKEVVDEALTELLGIVSLVVRMYAIRREGEHEVLHLWCAHRDEIALCTHCGTISTEVHQEEHRCIRHLDVWGKRTFLHFMGRRFQCEHCGRTFAEQLPFVDSHRRQSTAFEKAVVPDREKRTVEHWLDALSPQERISIRFISFDMWAPYHQAARSKLPHAKVVVDRFHVMKQLNTRLSQLRTEY